MNAFRNVVSTHGSTTLKQLDEKQSEGIRNHQLVGRSSDGWWTKKRWLELLDNNVCSRW